MNNPFKIPLFRNLSLAGPPVIAGAEAAAGGLRGQRAPLRLGADRRPALRHLLYRPRQQEHIPIQI